MFQRSTWAHIVSLWAVSVWLLCSSLQAQNVSGTLTGTVADPSGAVIPGAMVTMKNVASGDERKTVSNNDGFFSINAVQPGDYTVTISSQGFQSYQQNGVHFDAGDKRNLSNIALTMGSSTDTVTVSGTAEQLTPVDSGEKSIVIGQQQLQNIAIVGQNAAEFIKILPGFAMSGGTVNQNSFDAQQQSTGKGPVGSFSANGLRTGSLDITSDGAHTIDPGCNCGQAVNTVSDMTSELKVLTSNFGAENAKGPVVIAAIGKSGGNQFHGEAYLYARNNTFDATNAFNNSQGTNPSTGLKVNPKPDTYFYYPGANIGGPVIIPHTNFNHNHDKLFFFLAYEYYKQQVQDPAHDEFNSFVPTAEMRAGNFSKAYLDSYLGGTNSGGGVNPATGNSTISKDGIIPASRFNPIGVNMLKLYPNPNVDPGANNGYNYLYSTTHSDNMWQLRPRVDWSINDNTKLFVSYNIQREKNVDNSTLWWGTQPAVPLPSQQIQPNTSDSISVNLTKVFSPTLTNELIFTYTNLYVAFQYANPEKINAENLGVYYKHIFNQTVNNQLPEIVGWNDGIGNIINPSGYEKNNTLYADKWLPTLADNVSKVWGTHTAKFGMYWERTKNQQPSNNVVNGQLYFSPWSPSGSTNNSYANMLLGILSGYSETNFDPTVQMHYSSLGFFAQDSWKVSRRLTVDYGLRVDHLGPWIDETGVGAAVFNPSAYDPSAAPTALTGFGWHKVNSSVPVSGMGSRALFYEPRFGLAYDVFGTGRTVLRGGWGQYRYHDEQNVQAGALAFAAGSYTYSPNLPGGQVLNYDYIGTITPSLVLPGSINVLNQKDDQQSLTTSYSFTVSQRVPWSSTAEFSYVGNQAKYLNNASNGTYGNLNAVPYGSLFQTPSVFNAAGGNAYPTLSPSATFLQPYQSYGTIHEIRHDNYSNYNSLQVSWNKQSGHVNFLTNYTFSKSLGVRGENSSNGVGDSTNINNNYGVLGNDRTHIFNVAYVLTLPNMSSGNKLVRGVVNGWKASGISQWQSGSPLQAVTGSNFGFGGTLAPGTVLPNGVVVPATTDTNYTQYSATSQVINGTPNISVQPTLLCDPRTGLKDHQFLNGNCFGVPTPGHNGPIILPYIKGPAFFNNDLSMFKTFQLSEAKKIEFRVSAYNFLNHPLVSFNPTGATDNLTLSFDRNGKAPSGFGFANYLNGNRSIQFVLKFYF